VQAEGILEGLEPEDDDVGEDDDDDDDEDYPDLDAEEVERRKQIVQKQLDAHSGPTSSEENDTDTKLAPDVEGGDFADYDEWFAMNDTGVEEDVDQGKGKGVADPLPLNAEPLDETLKDQGPAMGDPLAESNNTTEGEGLDLDAQRHKNDSLASNDIEDKTAIVDEQVNKPQEIDDEPLKQDEAEAGFFSNLIDMTGLSDSASTANDVPSEAPTPDLTESFTDFPSSSSHPGKEYHQPMPGAEPYSQQPSEPILEQAFQAEQEQSFQAEQEQSFQAEREQSFQAEQEQAVRADVFDQTTMTPAPWPSATDDAATPSPYPTTDFVPDVLPSTYEQVGAQVEHSAPAEASDAFDVKFYYTNDFGKAATGW